MVFYKLMIKRDLGDTLGVTVIKTVLLPAATDDEAIAFAREIGIPEMLPSDKTELVGPDGNCLARQPQR
ncbi:hypothetical protein ACUXK4_004789 [Methylorubrum extorquens]